MTKPMYCPMSFGNPHMLTTETEESFPWLRPSMPKMECTPDCAWAVNVNGKYSCCFPVTARILSKLDLNINFRPLKDDDE